MCDWCRIHGDRDGRWYDRHENYLFNKVFPDPAVQEQKKQEMIATFAETEWRYAEPEYIRNIEFLRNRAASGFGSQVITKEEMLRILRLADEATKREDSLLVVGHCPCRLVYDGVRDYCCIGFGMPVSLSMEIGYGRLPREGLTEYGGAEWRELRTELRKQAKVPLKLDEAEELLDDWERRGLWHIIMSRGRMPLIEAVCNCERRYCTYWRNRFISGVPDYVRRGHFVGRIDPLTCTACGACVEMCQFGAVHHSRIADTVDIDLTMCFGCGLCRSVCQSSAITMVPRAEIPVTRDLW